MVDLKASVQKALQLTFPSFIPRDEILEELPAPKAGNHIEMVSGVRKSGRTYYLFQKMQQLIEYGFPAKRIFYFDFGDVRLFPLPSDAILQVIEEYWAQVPLAREKGCYLFLDEIQAVSNWQVQLRQVSEEESVTIVVTGSARETLAQAHANELSEQLWIHELFPLSFYEYCAFQGQRAPLSNDKLTIQARRLELLYDRYLEEGGFPGAQEKSSGEQVELLQSNLQEIIARDVAGHLGRGEIQLANQFAIYALRSSGSEFSINNLVESYKALGYKMYWGKADRILMLLQAAHLFDRVEEYAASLKLQSTSLPRIYAVDPGLSFAISPEGSLAIREQLKTAVYLDLRRYLFKNDASSIHSYSIAGAENQKIDFLLCDSGSTQPNMLIQICPSLQDEMIRNNEVALLHLAMASTQVEQATIITLREEESIDVEHGIIQVVPAWKWSLGMRDQAYIEPQE